MSPVRAELEEAGVQVREMRKQVAAAYRAVLYQGGRGGDVGEAIAAAHNIAGNPTHGKADWTKVDAAIHAALDALKAAGHELDRIVVLHKAAVDALDEADARRRQAAPGYRV